MFRGRQQQQHECMHFRGVPDSKHNITRLLRYSPNYYWAHISRIHTVLLGSRQDHHVSVGNGRIGRESFRLLVNDRRLEQIPLILETPFQRGEIEELYTLIE